MSVAVVQSPRVSPLPRSAAAVLAGTLVTLCIRGYQFGRGNHTIYLLDALRINDPQTLAADWWTTGTLQYHVLFSHLSAWLMRLGMIEPAFAGLYLLTTLFLHWAWLRLTRRLVGETAALATYLVSVGLYYLLLAGFGLGFYAVQQDSSFLPSNVAAVAGLWAIVFFVERRPIATGACIGLAGIWHLNWAVLGVGLWGLWIATVVFLGRQGFRRAAHKGEAEIDPALTTQTARQAPRLPGLPAWLIATLLAWGPCLLNIGLAMSQKLGKSEALPLKTFVALYVKLRHTHHYDPLSWPIALWVTYLAPLPIAWWAYRRLQREHFDEARRRAAWLVGLLLVMLAGATLLAGVVFVSETLVQLSLFRFSIYPKLLACIGAGWWIGRSTRGTTIGLAGLVAISAVLLVVLAASNVESSFVGPAAVGLLVGGIGLLATWGLVQTRRLATVAVVMLAVGCPLAMRQMPGVALPRPIEPGTAQMFDWIATHTPEDALFLTPPDDEFFRLRARRATVIGYKHVPQLSAELVTWRKRLEDVLALENLTALPTPMDRTIAALRERYDTLSPEHLMETAQVYEAEYVLTRRPLPGQQPLHSTEGWFLYSATDAAGLDPARRAGRDPF